MTKLGKLSIRPYLLEVTQRMQGEGWDTKALHSGWVE